MLRHKVRANLPDSGYSVRVEFADFGPFSNTAACWGYILGFGVRIPAKLAQHLQVTSS